ncbi:hypothetical protein RFI_24779 [Reticulomyxa filosa]|uniref:Uncharacterized protein n=1 Tax=Reticulomyxa filosa TaxID=46433 RepID=X6MFY4_RETFI|nr:hypothetical protein RFI_24779 [Reticulomyxa filosa]|eukprot:ETO12596.1 hypothetical protein RFI_24779 [Reticulomyxa filosa]
MNVRRSNIEDMSDEEKLRLTFSASELFKFKCLRHVSNGLVLASTLWTSALYLSHNPTEKKYSFFTSPQALVLSSLPQQQRATTAPPVEGVNSVVPDAPCSQTRKYYQLMISLSIPTILLINGIMLQTKRKFYLMLSKLEEPCDSGTSAMAAGGHHITTITTATAVASPNVTGNEDKANGSIADIDVKVLMEWKSFLNGVFSYQNAAVSVLLPFFYISLYETTFFDQEIYRVIKRKKLEQIEYRSLSKGGRSNEDIVLKHRSEVPFFFFCK